MRNKEIHEAFLKSGVKKWVVAERLGISDVTFSKRLRKELSQSDKGKILKTIEDLKTESEAKLI